MRLSDHGMPKEVSGIRIPDSELARKATLLVKELSSEALYHHVLRTYVFGALIAQRQDLKFDEELFYLAAVLHDLGLTERFSSVTRFEVAGADAADAFLAEQGVPEHRREVIWDAIALHTSVGIANRKRPEIALVHFGAGMDVIGLGLDDLPAEIVEQTIAALPRLDFKKVLSEALLGLIARHPQSIRLTWLEDSARHHVHGYGCGCPTFIDAVRASPFTE